MAKPFKGGSGGAYAPRVFQGGSGGATPPQVSFIASCGPLLIQIWRPRGEGKGHEERWLKLVGGGPRVTVRVELFGVSVGRVGVGRYLILSRLSDPKGSAD